MANFTSSPGVSLNEIDKSFISPAPIQVGAAIIGPAVKGPVEVPTVVTSYSDFKSRFGGVFTSGSDTFSYLTAISAYNYFTEGGESLLVARVVSASADYTSATSSLAGTHLHPTSASVVFETISKGTVMNSNGTLNSDGSISSGAHGDGTEDNIRWEITNSNTGSGTFNVIIRQGNDKKDDKIILETFNNVSLDPKGNNFISKVIGDEVLEYDSTTNQIDISSGTFPNQSRFVRVKSIANQTPDYLNNSGNPASAAYSSSIPINSSGSFAGGVGTDIPNHEAAKFYKDIAAQTQGLIGSDYNNMINLLANTNDYKFNILSAPGLTNDNHTAQISSIINNTIDRGDNIFILDTVDYDGSLGNAITQAQTRNTSYAATYWPWLQIQDPETGKFVFVPASTLIPGVYAFNDKIANTWNAPAGISRGGLSTVLRAKLKLTEANKSDLYTANVNPIATFPRKGVVVFGQKTLQKAASALDRVNVRRLLIDLKSFIGQVADTIVFEQNTATTRNKFIAEVTPFLETIQQKGGLYAFKVVMDDTNNTPDVIDRNQLIGEIFIQPTKTAEFISLDFIVLPTGAEFPA